MLHFTTVLFSSEFRARTKSKKKSCSPSLLQHRDHLSLRLFLRDSRPSSLAGLAPVTAGGLPKQRPPGMPPASVLLSCHVYEGDQGRRTSSPSSAERWPSEVRLHWVVWRRRPQLSWVSFLMLWHRGLWPLLSSSHFFGNNLALGRRTPLPPLIRLMLPAHACPCFLPFSTYCHWTQGQLACPWLPTAPFWHLPSRGPVATGEVPEAGSRGQGAVWNPLAAAS